MKLNTTRGVRPCEKPIDPLDPLGQFHPAVREWFEVSFPAPTKPQALGWPPIARGESTLILAPTGTGKTLAAFLACIDRLLFSAPPPRREACRVLYVSPLKALAVDVERNLRRPINGIGLVAGSLQVEVHEPRVFIRTGDTPAKDREQFQRTPADLLITTPESLYLMLTSKARDVMRSIETVIIDEIHALVPNKRGAHLALSLERLQAICSRPLQRIGLSATQRPLDEVARFLGGAQGGTPRPVTIIDAGERKPIEVRVEVLIEDMAQPFASRPEAVEAGHAGALPQSIWPSIHPKLLYLIRQHRSTVIFVNSRRLAERLAAALNELAGEAIVSAHHGSIARAQRLEIEERLKAGALPALVATSSAAGRWIAELRREVRIVPIHWGGQERLVAVEDAARYRDALGKRLPPGLPESLLRPVSDAIGGIVRRYARTHLPFSAKFVADRFGLSLDRMQQLLTALARDGILIEGKFRPGGHGVEWCDVEVLRTLRRKSLARLRREVEAVDAKALQRLVTAWQGILQKRAGPEGLLQVIERLQGVPIPASALESDVLPARIRDYNPADLDALCSAGEVVWMGVEPLGERDGRVALFFTDHAADLTPSPGFPLATSISGDEPEVSVSDETDRRGKIRAYLSAHGACFFSAIHEAAGSGYPGDTLAPLWELVWTGEVTNDTLMPLRSLTTPRQERRKHHTGRPFLSRRQVPPTGEGRWSLLSSLVGRIGSPTERAAARTKQLLERYGILTREAMATDSSPGGFAALYTVLRALEERGRIRRGYFVEGLGAMQFALPEAIDRLRRRREPPVRDEVVMLAATDPANLYGSVLGWPVVASSEVDGEDAGRRGPTRSAGCQVILINGDLAAFIGRGEPQFFVFIPEDEPARSRFAHGIADALVAGVRNGTRRGLFISMVNGVPATESELAPALLEAGFIAGPRGFMLRRSPLPGHDGQVAGEFRPGILS